jgi:hypothetical protein
MKHVLAALFVASSLIVTVAAQEQQPASPGQQPATRGEQPTTQGQQPATRGEQPALTQLGKVTISGCIQSPAAAAATTGAAPSTPAASKFELANAKVVAGAPVGTAGATATATRYRLEGEEKTISPHLNHQVEITGTISPAGASSAAGATAAPMLKVESVKMLAAKCSEPTR